MAYRSLEMHLTFALSLHHIVCDYSIDNDLTTHFCRTKIHIFCVILCHVHVSMICDLNPFVSTISLILLKKKKKKTIHFYVFCDCKMHIPTYCSTSIVIWLIFWFPIPIQITAQCTSMQISKIIIPSICMQHQYFGGKWFENVAPFTFITLCSFFQFQRIIYYSFHFQKNQIRW